MGEVFSKIKFDYLWGGFFYFFGFTENPAEKKPKAVINKSAAEKIKGDLIKVNKDFRKKMVELRKEALYID